MMDGSFTLKLLLVIGFAPLLTSLSALIFGEWALLVATAWYVALFVATLLVIVPVYLYLKSTKHTKALQLGLLGLFGFSAGCLVSLIAFGDSLGKSGKLIDYFNTLVPLGVLGFLHACSIWLLCTFGPFRLSGANQHQQK